MAASIGLSLLGSSVVTMVLWDLSLFMLSPFPLSLLGPRTREPEGIRRMYEPLTTQTDSRVKSFCLLTFFTKSMPRCQQAGSFCGTCPVEIAPIPNHCPNMVRHCWHILMPRKELDMALWKKNRKRSWLIAALGAALMATAGTASAQHRDNGLYDARHSGHYRSAGTLIVDGNRFVLKGRRSIVYQIREALRCAGYRAYVHDGCVTVRFRGRQPNVSLIGCDYGLERTCMYGRLTLRPYRIDHEYREPVYRPRGEQRRHRQPNFRWHYIPRRSRCDSGIRIRF